MSICKCGKEIRWGVTAEGKKIPLDMKAPVYAIVRTKRDVTEVCRTTLAMVNHYSTCSEAYKPKGERAWETSKGDAS